MKNWLTVICVLFLFTGCTKHTTPKKVEKRITKGTWKISSFSINGSSVASNYQGYTFIFKEGGEIKVGGSLSVSGDWELGVEKNPAMFYMNFPPTGGLENLSDEWQVTGMQKDLMSLERDSDGGTLVFQK